MSKLLVLILCLVSPLATAAPPPTFEHAKTQLRQNVYHDQNHNGQIGTFYCGCDWEWLGKSGGRVDPARCGFKVRAQENRGGRIEWEHIVPAHSFGQQRQCWQNGGRKHCLENDPVFRTIEADMHNLAPAVGELNADRSNFRFGVLPTTPKQHGACEFRVDFKGRVVEPRDEVKGAIARAYFYMYDRYNLRMSDQQQRLFMAWDKQFAVSAWELERDRRIARVMGHSNQFVTGERQWSRGHKNSGEGLVDHESNKQSRASSGAKDLRATAGDGAVIIGNRNSKVYHLPKGCPSYAQVSSTSRVQFATEAEAQTAGYRRAGNCR
ncbi:endonuclease [Steroidobacter cummioxidans]|uniref:endonuclease n=1 Tax=Steroidobacter cummioxidans TaxID=1803913 RepID=UPI000E312156|nr:endonuclease [Steroidobacter cummioxidans]